MANEIISQNTANAVMKWVAAVGLPALVARTPMINLVNRSYEAEFKGTGDTVNVPIAPVLTTNNLAEAGSITNQNASLGSAQIVLNRHRECTVALGDVMRAITSTNVTALYMDSQFKAMLEAIETDCLNVYPYLNANAAVGTANTSLTEAVIDSAETALFNAKVPADYNLVVSGTAYSQIRQLARFTEYQTAGPSGQPSPIVSGRLAGGAGDGSVKGMTVWKSQLVPKVSTTTNNICFSRDAIALAFRQMPLPRAGVIGEYIPYNGMLFRVMLSTNQTTFVDQMTVDCLYGVGPLRNNFGLVVLS